MFIQTKEGRQYSFSIEISSKEINDQLLPETISFFDKSSYKEEDVKELKNELNVDIPAEIFKTGNSGLKAIVKYLKDDKKLPFSRIAKILCRDQRTIWSAYHSKKSKRIPGQAKQKFSEKCTINSSIFANRSFSPLENAAMHLLKNYSVKETAQILGRNEMTIWTVKRRAEQKLKTKEERKKKER